MPFTELLKINDHTFKKKDELISILKKIKLIQIKR